MTATSGQVKTSGAYDELEAYVNKKLRIPIPSDKYWTRAFTVKPLHGSKKKSNATAQHALSVRKFSLPVRKSSPA
jgi:hypothetical protein